MKKFLDSLQALDHPLVFLVLLSGALISLWALGGIALKKVGLPGPATLIGAATGA